MPTTKVRAASNFAAMMDVILVMCIVVMTVRATTPLPDPRPLDQDELAIYSAAYREVDPKPNNEETLYISADYRGYGEVQEWIESLRPEVGVGLARAYAMANRHGGRHVGPPVTNRKHVVFAADSLLPNGFEYHAQVLEFTRPGINAARDSAVVQAGFGCGGLCGAWQTMLLAKAANGRWYVVKSFDYLVA